MPAKRVCPKPGCPTLIPAGTRYCPTHAREYELRRGKTVQRGYGAEHERLRAMWQGSINRGDTVHCARCGLPISGPWALDHTDDRSGYLGPSHKLCNDAAGGRASRR